MKVRLFFEGAGVAILLLVTFYWDFLSPYHLTLYHNPRPISPVVGGLAIDLFSACILLALIFYLLDRYDPRQASILWVAILGGLIVKVFNVAIFFLNYYDADIFLWRKTKTVIQLFVFGAALLLWWFFRPGFQKCIKAARVLLALTGCSILWILPQLFFLALHPPPKTITALDKPIPQSLPEPLGRIVWVLFDELSYDQVFEHRQSDVLLPNFDRLSKQSIVFTNVQPAGYFTDIIIPALFLGTKLDSIRSDLQGNLYVRETASSQWKPFNPGTTLFYRAQQLGWTTGVAGWFNPYCNILQGVLDSCYWQYINPFSHGLSDRKSVLQNAVAFPIDLGLSRFTGPSAQERAGKVAHIQEYQDVLDAADALLRNEAVRLAFIHLPVPHPPGIYDRKANTFSVRGTYLDNLVLADQTMGRLLDVLGKTAAASRTMLIVSSDHSWRIGMWRNDASWSREEERASSGKFDPRPVLLIHFPGETTSETETGSFPEIKTRELIEAMLQGRLHSQMDLEKPAQQ